MDANGSLGGTRAVPGDKALPNGRFEAVVDERRDAILTRAFLCIDYGAQSIVGRRVGSSQTFPDGEVGVVGTDRRIHSDVALGERQDSSPKVCDRELSESCREAWIS